MAPERECVAEVVDGVLDTSACGCETCLRIEHDRIEREVENGHISQEVALRRHAALGWDLGDPDAPGVSDGEP